MKSILLALSVLLMAPAYAQPAADVCDELAQCSNKLTSLLQASESKDLPLSDADKEDMRKAVEDFDKAIKNFYELSPKKIATKKHPKLRSIGAGLLGIVGALHSNNMYGYGSPFYTGGISPIIPTQNMMPTTFINPLPAFGQSPYTTITPGYGNTYTVFHLPGF
jgi:hypothetical protein